MALHSAIMEPPSASSAIIELPIMCGSFPGAVSCGDGEGASVCAQSGLAPASRVVRIREGIRYLIVVFPFQKVLMDVAVPPGRADRRGDGGRIHRSTPPALE